MAYYGETKVYFDGSHYIAIPKYARPQKPRRNKVEKEIVINEKNEVVEKYEEIPSTLTLKSGRVLQEIELINGEPVPVVKRVEKKGTRTTKKGKFEELYKANLGLKKRERRQAIIDGFRVITGLFKKDEDLIRYVDSNLERKERNKLCKRIRLTRKANLQDFNYFCTFTYDGGRLTEEEFKKRLQKCFQNFATRQHWKYIGVWERSPEKKRLHFHGVFYIPDGTMPGKLEEHNDYSFKTHRRQITIQNTYFNTKFGRSDFERIDKNKIGEALAYLMKYIEKSGERLVYSRGLPQYFISDIFDDDVVCRIGVDDRKLLLFDNFTCIDEGTIMGTVSKETIEKMRKAN